MFETRETATAMRRARGDDFVMALGKRERRKHVTRRDLLAAGRKLFGDRGLYESRVEDLTGYARIAKGTLYLYFNNKDALIQAVVGGAFTDLRYRILDRVGPASDLSERLSLVVGAHFEFFSENPDLMRILHQVRGMLKFNRREWRPLRHALRHHIEFIASLLADSRRGAPPKPQELRHLSWLVFGATSGVASLRASLDPAAAKRPMPSSVVGAVAAMGPAYLGARRTPSARRARTARTAPRRRSGSRPRSRAATGGADHEP
jgi:AcrR family transcriptional regulator